VDHYCWYRNHGEAEKGEKRCMKLYSARIYTEFGWVFVDKDE